MSMCRLFDLVVAYRDGWSYFGYCSIICSITSYFGYRSIVFSITCFQVLS